MIPKYSEFSIVSSKDLYGNCRMTLDLSFSFVRPQFHFDR